MLTHHEAVEFLELLRPDGPWVLTAIVPDGGTETTTARTADDIAEFVAKHNGVRNLYYSVNPTRGSMTKKAAKTDIAAIEYLLSDLDPQPDETPEGAKARYLAALDKFKPEPTAIVDSGNGIQTLYKLAERIELPDPVILVSKKGERKLVFPTETAALIADVENRVKSLMETLGGTAGTQNIDRILRLPGTVNLPNKKKLATGRIACPTRLIRFNGATCQLEDFPSSGSAKTSVGTRTTEPKPLPTRLADMLMVANTGAGRKHGGYESRSTLLFAFLTGCIRAGVNMWGVAYEACLDDKYAGKAIWEHCHDQGNASAYLERQIERAQEKCAAPVEELAQLSLIEYEQQRKQAAKTLGVRVSQLDRMVGAARERDQKEDVDSKIAGINAEHALVLAGNKAAVMKFEDKTKFRLIQVGAFKQWFSNQLIPFGKKAITLGDYWLGHLERRQYQGIEFVPPGSATRPGYYNLFQGFAVEPKAGDCSKFLAHVKENAARGDDATYKWIVGWWAQILQQPSIKMETALVLRGPFGAGKTKIGQVMGSLIGDHYLLVASPRYITGQFNSHMASLLVLHADEAFWAGDKASVGTLRDLVTGEHHMLEYKHVDPIRIKNHMRLFVTGNPDWMVPAGFKERRWAIFDMGEDHMQDHSYFAAIDHEMNNGGREALLHHLLNFDLSQVDLRTIPKTAALLDQQIASMSAEEAWWLETLIKGVLPPKPRGVNALHTFLREDLYMRYIRHAQLQGVNYRSIETKLGSFLHKQLGAGLKNKRPSFGTERLHCYELPPLRDCRRLFAEKLGQPVDWGVAEWQHEEWQHETTNFHNWTEKNAEALKKATRF